MAEQKIAVQGDDHFGLVELVVRHRRAGLDELIPIPRLVLVPLRLRVLLQQRRQLRRQRGRGHGVREDAQARPGFCALLGQRGHQISQKLFPRTDLPSPPHGLRPVGIIEFQDRRLVENARRAQAHRVVRVALDFRWPALVTLHQ